MTGAQAAAIMSAMFGPIAIAVLALRGALGLLCLIPSIGPLVCRIILAVSTWPNALAVSRPVSSGSIVAP